MTSIWEETFQKIPYLWGHAPADSAVQTAALFSSHGFRTVLVPGAGYGRNARPFVDRGMDVTGLELSETAVDLAGKQPFSMTMMQGDISELPSLTGTFDGIYSHALLHLLPPGTHEAFVRHCFQRLNPGGCMVHTTITPEAPMFGRGTKLADHYYEASPGVPLYFYTEERLRPLFSEAAQLDISMMLEPNKEHPEKAPFPYWHITAWKT
ncbi:class I SAM-dependent methyltransferase [Alkalicoccus urumqiensis]|uniref:SAM-dependent methyltransferase n=1 Tax=Alkalicoccus urumqiensis TaxID=1548213 RepID=A0A2P6MJA0_ALKUR|nr:class I SAM-dependent methyltransferase [Alkalicoccus urumqiensis]PRO66330.1 SAM-dependent methyltransferase [Alkalicoccus urumqiensis]